MKARRKGSNGEWQDVQNVTLAGQEWNLINAEAIEFQHDTLSTELKTNEQMNEEAYWQDVRERAAIAAMQGTITILSSSDRSAFREIVVEGFKGTQRTYPNEVAEFAIACADELVKQLKEE